MKKIAKAFVLAVMLFVSGQAMAQYRGALFFGASFPMKDFGDFDGYNEFALMQAGKVNAGASIGFNAGIKWYFNVGVKDLSVLASVDGFYNGPNSDLKTAYRNDETSYDFGEIIGSRFKYDATPKYINFPAMIGVNYIYHINPNLGVYVEAGAGGNFRLITDLETYTKGQLLGQDIVIKECTDYDNAFGFAYQAGLGFEVAKNLVVGCSFYDLGNAEVKAKLTRKDIVNQNHVTETVDYKTYGDVHPVMIVGRVGFCF